MLILKTSNPNTFQVVCRVNHEEDHTDFIYAVIDFVSGSARIEVTMNNVTGNETDKLIRLAEDNDFAVAFQSRYFYPNKQTDMPLEEVISKIKDFALKIEEVLLSRIHGIAMTKFSEIKKAKDEEKRTYELIACLGKLAV